MQNGIGDVPNPKRPLQDFPLSWSRKWEKSKNWEFIRRQVPGTAEGTSLGGFCHRLSWSGTGRSCRWILVKGAPTLGAGLETNRV